MCKFTDKRELIRFANVFIKERVDSLDKDVRHCLQKPFAPFPALLYCFSTIDLLGALYGGNATGNTVSQSKLYMKDVMHYCDDQIYLLQNQFRHKIVHLVQPKPMVQYKNQLICWLYDHNNQDIHLKLIPVKQSSNVQDTYSCDFVFAVSIFHLMKDIKDSVESSNGYLARLLKEQDLQKNFEKAIKQINDPKK